MYTAKYTMDILWLSYKLFMIVISRINSMDAWVCLLFGGIPMKKIRFGVLGYGAIGRVHAGIIQNLPCAELVAVSDPNVQNASMLDCEVYDSYQALLCNAKVDAVSVCLPSGLHMEATCAAARLQKHVICEKPIDIDLARAQEMVAACKANGVKFGVIMQHRFDPPILLLQKAISEGRLGRILWGSSKTIWYRDDAYYANPGRGTWHKEGGGALISQSIHYIDLLLCILGDVKSVSAKCRKLRHHGIEAEDVGVANIEFANGTIGTVEGTTAAYPGLFAELSIYGEKGCAVVRNDELMFYHLAGGKDPEFEALLNPEKANRLHTGPAIDPASHEKQYLDFIEAIVRDREPRVTGEATLKGLQLIKAIYRASDEKREIYL